MSTDKLVVQVSLKIKAPKGAEISKKALNQILDRIASGKRLPRNVKVAGIFWRNPNRRGSLGYWRWHTGADLSVAPSPRESSPRGNLRDAIDTLGNALAGAVVTF